MSWHDLGAKGAMEDRDTEPSLGYEALLISILTNARPQRVFQTLNNNACSLARDIKFGVTLNSLQGGQGQEIRYGGCGE